MPIYKVFGVFCCHQINAMKIEYQHLSNRAVNYKHIFKNTLLMAYCWYKVSFDEMREMMIGKKVPLFQAIKN